MPSELDQLRAEVRDVRYLTEAVLMQLVGRDNMLTWEIEARVQSSMRRRRGATPLRDVGIRHPARDVLTSSYGAGLDVETLEELVQRWPREKISAMKGVGPRTMLTIDAAVAERGLTWAEVA